jgi:pimeloyl-ACP methyl ester carboxylesterase
MGSFVEPMVQQGWHVVAVDLPAHGETSGDFATLPLLAEVVGALGARLQPKVIIAHSMGATATAYALTKGLSPEVVALLAPPAQLPPYLGYFVRQAGLSGAMQDRLLARVERILQQPVSELDLLVHAPRLGHVSALLVHDRSDVVVPVASSRELESAWPGAHLVVTEGLSHDRIRRDGEVVGRVVAFVGAHQQERREPRPDVRHGRGG